jgi:hypothetical protein
MCLGENAPSFKVSLLLLPLLPGLARALSSPSEAFGMHKGRQRARVGWVVAGWRDPVLAGLTRFLSVRFRPRRQTALPLRIN